MRFVKTEASRRFIILISLVWTAGWFRLGSSLAALHLTDEAVVAFEQGSSLAPE